MNFAALDIPSARLLLDPNNYRFHDLPTYRAVPNRARYAEAGVQDRALGLLQTTDSFDLESLKDSIKTNTYVPLERVSRALMSGLIRHSGHESSWLNFALLWTGSTPLGKPLHLKQNESFRATCSG